MLQKNMNEKLYSSVVFRISVFHRCKMIFFSFFFKSLKKKWEDGSKYSNKTLNINGNLIQGFFFPTNKNSNHDLKIFFCQILLLPFLMHRFKPYIETVLVCCLIKFVKTEKTFVNKKWKMKYLERDNFLRKRFKSEKNQTFPETFMLNKSVNIRSRHLCVSVTKTTKKNKTSQKKKCQFLLCSSHKANLN